MAMSEVLPLLADASDAIIMWWRGEPVTRARFLLQVTQIAERLPPQSYAFNLCDDRYLFLAAFAAVSVRGQTNLLPSSRAEQALQELRDAYPDHHSIDDDLIEGCLASPLSVTADVMPMIAADHTAAITFTSGSTGHPQANPKPWWSLVRGAELARRRFQIMPNTTLVATVPAQHMYGLETSIMLPLHGPARGFGGRPFFPADIHAALTAVPEPRVLISTPTHLRVCVEAGLNWPSVTLIISATAPMPEPLAQQVEAVLQAPLLEIYGCTEAGSVASRRTLAGDIWRTYAGVTFGQTGDSCYAQGGHLAAPTRLNDRLELFDSEHFKMLGRDNDLVNIAGKRASLAYLNQCLLAIAGVEDGVFLLPEETSAATVARLSALVVAPGVSEQYIMAELARRIDPAFLPRPLYKVPQLPRNETGKLPRRMMLALYEQLQQSA